MRQCGDNYEDKVVNPINVFADAKKADKCVYEFRRRMAHLEGKLMARSAIMTEFVDDESRKHFPSETPQATIDEMQEHLNIIFEINKDIKDLGFISEDDMSHPIWYVVVLDEIDW